MAQVVQREQVQDPLATNVNANPQVQQFSTQGIRNPGQTSGSAGFKVAQSALGAIDAIKAAVGQVYSQQQDDLQVQGQIAFAQGKTYESMTDKASKRGWQAMSAVNSANQFFAQEQEYLTNGGGDQLSGDEYRARLNKSYQDAFSKLPNDPAVRKSWSAAWLDMGPRLAAAQMKANNEYNINRGTSELANNLMSGASVNSDSSAANPSTGFRVQQKAVMPEVPYGTGDADLGIRTLLSEAAGEGQQGMAAVAQVIRNRVTSGRFPNSVSQVILQDKQFTGVANNGKWDPNSTVYQQAKEVWEATMSGHVVDQTGGATHYFNPSVVEPDWHKGESSGNDIMIGNHLFLGHAAAKQGSVVHAPDGQSAYTGDALAFAHPEQNNLQGRLQDALVNTSGALGKQLQITSGFRSKEYNKSVGGAENSRHVTGDAVDISMEGMNDQERAQLVQTLQQNGINRFITYTNEPDMLHVDDDSSMGSAYFMHDKSNSNLSKAPAWFQAVANGTAAALPPTGEQARPTGSQMQRLIQSSPLPRSAKAEAVTSAMIRGLATNDDTTFNDAGGFATLLALGATPDQITRVQTAKDKFDQRADQNFDLGYEQARASLLSSVSGGQYKTEEEAIAAVAQFQKQYGNDSQQSQSNAKALAREVANKWEQAQKDKDGQIVPLEFRDQVARLKSNLDLGIINAREAADGLQTMGKRFGMKDSVVNGFMGDMYSAEAARDEKLKTEAAATFKKQQQEAKTVADIQAGLARGTGVMGITGRVTIPDDAPGNPDGTKEVSAQEYAIWELTNRTKDDLSKQMQRKEITPEQAQVKLYSTVYTQLARQGIVDKQSGQQMAAAVSGNLIDPVTKEVREDALAALDKYMQLSDNPEIGQAYADSMIEDPQAKQLLHYARAMYSGHYNPDDALKTAQTHLSDPLDPPKELAKSGEYSVEVIKQLKDFGNELVGNTGWLGSRAGFPQPVLDKMVTNNDQQIQSYLYQQANSYFQMNKNVPAKVAVSQAVSDLKENAIPIGGDIAIGSSKNNQRLDQVMGLTGFGKRGPNDALMDYIKDLHSGADNNAGWGQAYRDIVSKSRVENDNPFGETPASIKADYAELGVQYNPISGTLHVQLFKDHTRTETVGDPIDLDAKTLGDRYKKKMSTGQIGAASQLWRDKIIDPAVDAAHSTVDTLMNKQQGSLPASMP